MNINIEPDKMTIAEAALLDAAAAVRTRNIEHGHTLRSFTLISELWTAYIKHAYTIRGDMSLRADDVAQMQTLVKLARSVYGESGDNYIDQAGYAALSAMLRPDAILKWEADRQRERDLKMKTNFKAKVDDQPHVDMPVVSFVDDQPEYPTIKIRDKKPNRE